MKQYWVVIGVRENSDVVASFSSEEAAKNYAAYLAGNSKESFYCLVREPKRVELPEGRKITDTLASRFREKVFKALSCGKVDTYSSVDRNTWLSSNFGHGLSAMYYDSVLFGVYFKEVTDDIHDVSCIFHSRYLTWSTMIRMQSACRLLRYAAGFRIIDGQPWLVGNCKQIRLPVDKPFLLMRYIKVLFNEY